MQFGDKILYGVVLKLYANWVMSASISNLGKGISRNYQSDLSVLGSSQAGGIIFASSWVFNPMFGPL